MFGGLFGSKNSYEENNLPPMPEAGEIVDTKQYKIEDEGIEYELNFIADGNGGVSKGLKNSNLSVGEQIDFSRRPDLDNPKYLVKKKEDIN